MMRTVRFREPAGSVRKGTYDEGDGTVVFGNKTYSIDEVDVLAPSLPSKIVCVGLNYADHAEESGMEVPERPWLFLKPPNAVATHNSTVTLPANKDRIDFEAEIGVIVGEQCRQVSAEDAMDVVEGFTCVNDLSNRDDQFDEQNWVRGKAFDNSAPVGPVVASPEEVPADARITARVNGETKQDSTRKQLIFSVPELIEEITAYLTLEQGDVIATGTPAGVGPLSDGDTVEVEVTGVGTLEHTVRIPE
jgi:2-keto-4-pentenoate hydratase/2-oxohepta-3-ene-1,7-dioic acid hydratase in catechol pathway